MTARERAGVQVGNGHITAIEYDGYVAVLANDGVSGVKVKIGVEDARHLATMLRRIARRVERQPVQP